MEELFREKLKFFLGGAIAGALSGGYGLFNIPVLGTDVARLVLEYTTRFVGTIFIAFVSGMLTVMFKDFYDIVMKKKTHSAFHWFNNKLSKKKVKNENNGKANKKDAA